MKYERQRLAFRYFLQGGKWTTSEEGICCFSGEMQNNLELMHIAPKAMQFYQEHSVGRFILSRVTSLSFLFPRQRPADLIAGTPSKIINVTHSTFKLGKADLQALQLFDSSIDLVVTTHASLLHSFYSPIARTTVAVGDYVFVGDDDYICRLRRIVLLPDTKGIESNCENAEYKIT
jgi:hypothetical protein